MLKTTLLLIGFSFLFVKGDTSSKMNGVNFVSPPKPIESNSFSTLKNIEASWVAFNPFGYAKAGKPELRFDVSGFWWGESTTGTKKLIDYSRQYNFKIMIKPHVWVTGQGWPGDFILETEKDWRIWEADYEKYILAHAKIAADNNVELLCIGTEYRHAVKLRQRYWQHLIREIKKVYSGKLTYAANWDNYENVQFWNELDYIGIDAYFPLSKNETAKVAELNKLWRPIKQKLENFSKEKGKPILFTEYGYKSMSKTTWKQWELPESWQGGNLNLQAQQNAYVSIYQTFWNEDWFAGGFLWKWYSDTQEGGNENTDYTPQNKPVEATIKKWYSN